MAQSKLSLFGTLQKTAEISTTVNSEFVRQIALDKIKDNPLNRFSMQEDEEFIRVLQSVEQDGFLEDLIVTPDAEGTYRIISGHRRAAIARKLGKTQIPCKVRTYRSELDEVRALIGANLHKRTLTPFDMARQLQTLSEVLDRAGMPNGSKERAYQLAAQTGLSRATVERYLDLLRLNDTIISWVEQGAISMVDAYELARKKNLNLQQDVVALVVQMDDTIPLSDRIRQALEMVKRGNTAQIANDHKKTKCTTSSSKMLGRYRRTMQKMTSELSLFSANVENPEILSEQLLQFENALESLLSVCHSLEEQLRLDETKKF